MEKEKITLRTYDTGYHIGNLFVGVVLSCIMVCVLAATVKFIMWLF